jgi:hypothetical protein
MQTQHSDSQVYPILSSWGEAKDLLFGALLAQQVLRFAQDDK